MTEKHDGNSNETQLARFTLKNFLSKIFLACMLFFAGYVLAYLIEKGLKLALDLILWILIPH